MLADKTIFGAVPPVGVSVCRDDCVCGVVCGREGYRIIGNSEAVVVVGARRTGGIALWIH